MDSPPAEAAALDMGPYERATELTCGVETYEALGESYQNHIVYNLDRINAKLAESSALRSRTGLSRVTSCEGAEAFDQAQRPTVHSGPTDHSLDVLETNEGLSEKIFEGSIEGRRGSVRFRTWKWTSWNTRTFCSGTLISQTEMVTAAHCFDQALGTTSGAVFIEVDYQVPGGNDLKITQDDFLWAVADVTIHPDYFGGSAASADIAVVELDARRVGDKTTVGRWQHLPTGSHFVALGRSPVFDGQGFRISASGLSSNSSSAQPGVTRTTQGGGVMTLKVGEGGLYFFNKAPSWGRMCAGDSGSMAVQNSSSRHILIGVHSDGERLSSNCVATGNLQYWSAVPPRADWINAVTGGFCDAVDYQGAAGIKIPVYECW